jgi:hypothetical protein
VVVSRWLDRLADEGHASERLAGYYHLGFVAGYLIAAAFHAWCARRHLREA